MIPQDVKLSLANNETKQFTPMKVSWFDNENLLVIFGYGQGRVTLGRCDSTKCPYR